MKSELGRYSVTLYRNFKAVKYWLRIICMPNDKLPKLCYKLQRQWVENDINCWALKVRDLLFHMGLGEVWLNQGVVNTAVFLKVFKTRLQDIKYQMLNSDIRGMDILRTYKLLNSNFGCESYLHCIKNKVFRSVMSTFRGGLLRLKSNEGHYNGIPFDERVCPLCEGGIEAENIFHPFGIHFRQLKSLYSCVQPQIAK